VYFGNLPFDVPADSVKAVAAKAGKIDNIEFGRQNRCVSWPRVPGANVRVRLVAPRWPGDGSG
jgi:hypothetical protein